MELSVAHTNFKNKYGFTVHSNFKKFKNWANENTFSLKTLFPSINKEEIYHIDLSDTSNFIGGEEEFNNIAFFQNKIDQLQKKVPKKIITGGYLEKRALYTSNIYTHKNGLEKRNTHLGVDFWLPEKTAVYALLDGEVVCATNNASHKGYGGLLILKHKIDDFYFYSLYGHATVKSVLKHKVGNVIKKGEQVVVLASSKENGDWVPHLHFQIMLTLLDFKNDFPGVAFESEIDIWKTICPNPNLLFKLDGFNN